MPNKYLELTTAGALSEKEATATSAGAGDAGELVALNASGKLDDTLFPASIGPEARTVTASETITGPALGNLWNDTGTLKVRYADASASNAGKAANCYVPATISSGATGSVYFEGVITGLSALTIGSKYFLSGSSPGQVTETAPTTAGHCVQAIGVALSTTELSFEPAEPVIRA